MPLRMINHAPSEASASLSAGTNNWEANAERSRCETRQELGGAPGGERLELCFRFFSTLVEPLLGARIDWCSLGAPFGRRVNGKSASSLIRVLFCQYGYRHLSTRISRLISRLRFMAHPGKRGAPFGQVDLTRRQKRLVLLKKL